MYKSRENPCIGCELFCAYGWRGRRRNRFNGDVYCVVHMQAFEFLRSFKVHGGPRWHSVYGAVLQIGRSLVRSQMVSLEFFVDIVLPIALWPWGRLSL